MNLYTWGVRAFFAGQGLFWAFIAVIAVRDWWRRATYVRVTVIREIDAGRAGQDIDQAVALVCKPCNGEAGLCSCSSKCGNWLCGADDTGTDREAFDRELAEWLRGDGRHG